MRLKDVCGYTKGFAFKVSDFVETGVPLIKATDIKQYSIQKPSFFIDASRVDEFKSVMLFRDDIVISSVGSQSDVTASAVGQLALIDKTIEGSLLNQNVVILRFNNKLVNCKYIFYNFTSNSFRKHLNYIARGTANQASIKISETLVYESELPSLNRQTQIANYLDTKTQAIDKKINLLTQKANYYKEYRKSLINETVCKGLDKNVNTKEIELGFNVNVNYIFYRLKDLGYLYSGLSGKAGEDFNQEDNQNNKGFIPFTNIANNTYLKKDHLGTVVVYDNENQNKVKKEDIFFLMSSEGYEDIGKSAILDDNLNETYLNSFCKGFRVTNKKANPYFLNYLLLSDNYRKLLTVEGKGFTRINLKMEKVNDFIVFIPNDIDEQNKIVSFLDDKTQTIDKIVSNINSQINALKELRKTLINDAVTGKIKVVF